MILFMGAITKGYFAEEICNQIETPFEYIAQDSDIKVHTKEIMKHDSIEYLIYDIEQYTNHATEIADNIVAACNAKNAKPIILASGFQKESNIVLILQKAGIYAFIFSLSASGRKNELKNYIDDYYKYLEEISSELENITVELPEEIISVDNKKKEPKFVKTMAFAGAMHRIGTTTQALQAAKLYVTQGMKPCYITLDNPEFVQNIGNYYTDTQVHDGMVTYAGIDMYFDPDRISEIGSQNYDCYIYDYGIFSGSHFSRLSFLEKEKSFIVCGGNPGEILYTNKILDNFFYKDVNYIFSFVSEAEKKDILELMEDLKEKTYFTGYIPDPFDYSISSDFYKKIIGIVPKEKKQFMRFFRKKR